MGQRESHEPFDPNDESKFWLGRDVVAAILLGRAGQSDLLTFRIPVFFDVCLGSLENSFALRFGGLEGFGGY